MGYRELYEPYRQEVEERYPLVMERISDILTEETVQPPFRDYFQKVAAFVIQMYHIEREAETGAFFEKNQETLKALQETVYRDVLPEHYSNSYANPAYAVKMLGEDHGRLLCALYGGIRQMTGVCLEQAVYEMTIYGELFVEIYNCFEDTEGTSPQEMKNILYWFYHDYSEVFVERSISRRVNPEEDFFAEIVRNADLTDLRYLYRYGHYISDNERRLAEFLNRLPEEKIQAMADAYMAGYCDVTEANGTDSSKKKVVGLSYPMGSERIVRAVIGKLAKLGLRPVIGRGNGEVGVNATSVNRQYEFDHKADAAVYLNKAYVERHLECQRTAWEKNKERAALFAGTVVMESPKAFGNAPFTPESKPENYVYSEKQQKLNVYFSSLSQELTSQYIQAVEPKK